VEGKGGGGGGGWVYRDMTHCGDAFLPVVMSACMRSGNFVEL